MVNRKQRKQINRRKNIQRIRNIYKNNISKEVKDSYGKITTPSEISEESQVQEQEQVEEVHGTDQDETV